MTHDLARGIYVVAYRESLRLFRDRARMLSSLAMPLLFLGIFGGGFNRTIGGLAPGVDFLRFLFPGIVAQTVFMTSIFSGLSVVWDREFGFLRELLVAPISRAGIVAGKVIGGAGLALIQALIILFLAPLIGVPLNLRLIAEVIPLLLLVALSLSSFGILIATRLRSQQAFQMLMPLVVFPMMFVSGIFFPVNNVPAWLALIAKLNPLTYGVDAIRHVFLDDAHVPSLGVSLFGHAMTLGEEALLIAAFGAILLTLATIAFSRQD